MKKISLFSLWIILLSLGSIQAQTMAFAEAVQDTFKLPANATDFLEIEFQIVNLTSDTLEVTAARVVNDTTPGHETFFCWDICYGFGTDQSISFIEILPNDTSEITYITFEPMGVNGVTQAVMEFTNMENREVLSRTFTYQVGELTSLESSLSQELFSLPYPLPAQDFFWVNVDPSLAGTQLELWSMNGKHVHHQSIDLTRAPQKVLTKDLASGHYFLHLRSGQKLLDTRRVFISQN
ncbi:MAG: T9SS type A sorting domain-containing protein [Bacteroidota bacterium]